MSVRLLTTNFTKDQQCKRDGGFWMLVWMGSWLVPLMSITLWGLLT